MTRKALLASVALLRPQGYDTGYYPPLGPWAPTAADPLMPGLPVRSAASDVMLKRSADTAAMVPYWDLVEALTDGLQAVRDCGDKFLPKFHDESAADFEDRLKQTKLTNIYSDIVEALASKPFEEEVKFVEEEGKPVPLEILEFAEDVDGSGVNLTGFAASVFYNGINSAVDWIWIDQPPLDPAVRTVADAKAAGIRPTWARILGRNVLSARTQIIKSKETLVYFKVFEPAIGEYKDRIRISERVGDTAIWALYEKTDTFIDGKTQFALIENGTFTIGIIPGVWFATGRRDGKSFKFTPAMRAAAELQRELYQEESGLKHVKVLAGYPMLSGNGVKPDMDADGKPKRLAVSPRAVLYAPPDGKGNAGSWTYVEPGAQTMTFLKSDIDETKKELRELGRQPLTAQSGNLTVITTAVAAGKAKSAVSAWAGILKNTLENAFVITALWMKIDYDPQLNVFDEWDDMGDANADMTTLQAMRSAPTRDLSRETLWEEGQRRGILSPEFNAEREEARLLAEVPSDTGVDTSVETGGNGGL